MLALLLLALAIVALYYAIQAFRGGNILGGIFLLIVACAVGPFGWNVFR